MTFRHTSLDNPKLFASVEDSTPPTKEPVVRQKMKMHEVRCFIEDEVMQQLERCKELLSSKYPKGLDYNGLLQELAASWLERHDPVKRSERREARKQRSKRAQRAQRVPKPRSNDELTRHIPVAVRDAVFERDGGRCTFVGEGGKRCNSTWDLEVHHDGTPFGRGGGHSIKNLRLLCATHNQFEAEKEFGNAHVEKHYLKETPVAYQTLTRQSFASRSAARRP